MALAAILKPGRDRQLKLRSLFWPGVFALLAFAVLIGLGTWQIYRLHWKEGLLERIAQAEAAPPVPLQGHPSPFRKVSVTGTLAEAPSAHYGAEVRDTRAGPRMGSYLIQVLQRTDAPPVLVERGWVPANAPGAVEKHGTVTIEGYVHPPDRAGWFSASDNPVEGEFFTLDPAKIGAALGFPDASPFVLVALGPDQPGHYPVPALHLPRPPNNHLSYAVTWYGLAAALMVIFLLWARKVLSA